MNIEQYRQLCANQRARGPLRLGEPTRRRKDGRTALAMVLADAARRQRRLIAAKAAWHRIAEPRFSEETAVDVVAGDTVIVAVRNSTALYDLSRRQATLERRMVELVPGVHRLQFVMRAARPNVDR